MWQARDGKIAKGWDGSSGLRFCKLVPGRVLHFSSGQRCTWASSSW